jgi:hypothetical protein
MNLGMYLDESVFKDICYMSCITKDNGTSYVCKEFGNLNKSKQYDKDAVILPKNCACPRFAQFFRLTRELGTKDVKIL